MLLFIYINLRSGIEIQFTEKESLINNIYDIMKEFKSIPKKKLDSNLDLTTKRIGVEDRNKWTELLENSRANVIHDHNCKYLFYSGLLLFIITIIKISYFN